MVPGGHCPLVCLPSSTRRGGAIILYKLSFSSLGMMSMHASADIRPKRHPSLFSFPHDGIPAVLHDTPPCMLHHGTHGMDC